ncbi:MAG: FAD-binding oxidoreductase [Acidobacteria bacterium]|nr:FAD-binding oxidoreductase [Acidobacteriota bacterium]
MQVKTQLEDLQNYLTDASNMQGGHATRLCIPETAGEVADILHEANEQGIAVTISGLGRERLVVRYRLADMSFRLSV